MISTLNLVWIIPLTAILGMGAALFIAGASTSNREYDAYQRGLKDGMNKHKEKLDLPSMIISLEEFYDRILNSDFNKFSEITGDVIYELQGNQLCMLFIDDIDSLCEYFDYDVVEMNDEGQYTRPIIKKRPNNIH